MTKISDNIRKIRELRNFTQESMAQELGMTQAGYSKIENANTDITFSKIEEIATILKLTPEELLSFDSQRYFNSFNDAKRSNISSVVVGVQLEDLKKFFEDKISLQEKLLQAYEASLKRYRDLYGDME